MVGKKELLGWVSATCGRPVASFSALKDGDALVRCVEETWPLAYDEVQPRFPKRMDGSRDSKENFELVKAVFASIGLPPEALDVRGVRASAFKPCYNLLVVCFFLRNLALHGDFSVDFTHQIDATLTQFLQSPASVESLRRGGALPPGPGEKTPGKKPRKKAESAPRRPRRRASGAPDAAPALSLLGSALETATAASPYGGIENGGIEPSEPNAASPTRGPDAKPTRRGLAYRRGERATRRVPSASSSDPVFRPPSPPRGVSTGGGGGAARGAPRLGTPDRSTERPRRNSDSLGRFLRRRSAGGDRSALGVYGTDAMDANDAKRAEATPNAVKTLNESEGPLPLFRYGDRPGLSSPRDGRADADDAFSSDALASARFEAEGLRRVLRGAKSERDDAAKRHEAELDALRARFAADAEATRAAERKRRHELELRFAERQTSDQRAFLRELRAVAEETAGFATRSADESSPRDADAGGTAPAKRRAALENVRGREVAALEMRVRSLEEERERLLVDLAGATAALNENATGDEGEGDEGGTNDVAARRRAAVVRLRNELRLAEARHVADASSRAREIDELRLELRVTRGELADAKHARRFTASEADGRVEDASASPVFAALLGEHRDARRVARLEAEAKQARDVASAARRQVDALLSEARRTDADANGKPEKTGKTENTENTEDDDTEDDAALAAADAGAVLRAVAVLRDAALAPDCDAEAAEAAAAATRAAEAAAWRRRRRRRDAPPPARARAAAAEARARVALLETEARDAEAAVEAREASPRRRARDAEEDLARERAAGGVRAALAEEAERLARSEAEEARREAADARQDASAAHGASAGALRDARDVAAKLKLRETHWVGLVACHREAASVSRAVAERVAKTSFGFGTTETENETENDLATRLELERHKSRRLELETEAAKHAEAIEAIAAMLPEKIRDAETARAETYIEKGKMSISGGESARERARAHASAREIARLEARASAAESATEALRARLARKTEDAAALALRAKRHELRAEEAALAAEASARERRDAADAHRAKQAETEDLVRRSRIDADAARREASAAKAALEDRDAALDVGVAVVRADPELARSMMRANARVVDDANDDDDDDEAEDGEADVEDIARTESGRLSGSPARSFGGFAPNVTASARFSPRPVADSRFANPRKDSKSRGVVPLTSPEAVAAAVAEATRAIATTPGSIESRAPGGRSRTSSRGAYHDARFETFADLDDVVKPPRRRDARTSPNSDLVSKKEKKFATSPGGESVGSVGETLGATLGETLATPDAHRAVDDAVDALVDAEAAGAETRGLNEPPPSPFRGFLDMFSPRRGARAGSPQGAAAPSVEEETEDSEATDPGTSLVREGEAGTSSHTKEDAGFVSPARASPTAGLTSYSPLPGARSGTSSLGTSSLGLPGGSSFVRDAEAHLAIEVKRSWFGLKDDEDPNASPSSRRSETNVREGPGE